MKKLPIIFIFIVTILVQGCGTPQVVKSLSIEQLNAQKTSRENLATYFGMMEQIINNQIMVFKAEEDDDLQEEISIFQKQYNYALKKAGANKSTLLDELSNKIKTATINTNNLKITYNSYLSDIKKKHMEILEIMDNMVIAQETLNSYIQIEKADEVVANTIFSALGTDQVKVRKYSDEINNILTSMQKIKGTK